MADRLTLRKEKHGDITVFFDQHGWKRGFLYFEYSFYCACGPLGLDVPVRETTKFASKRLAEAALRKAIREAWNA